MSYNIIFNIALKGSAIFAWIFDNSFSDSRCLYDISVKITIYTFNKIKYTKIIQNILY